MKMQLDFCSFNQQYPRILKVTRVMWIIHLPYNGQDRLDVDMGVSWLGSRWERLHILNDGLDAIWSLFFEFGLSSCKWSFFPMIFSGCYQFIPTASSNPKPVIITRAAFFFLPRKGKRALYYDMDLHCAWLGKSAGILWLRWLVSCREIDRKFVSLRYKPFDIGDITSG